MIKAHLKKAFSSQLRLNMLSGSISTGLGVVVSAVKYPLYLHFLGYEHYGAWLLLSTVLVFAQMGLLGIAPAIIKFVAEEYGKGNNRAIQEYFTTALCMLAIVGVLLIAISILFKWQIVTLMGVKGEDVVLVGNLFVYMAIFSIGVLVYQVLNSVLAGVGRIDIANYSQTALQVLPLLISIPLLVAGKGVMSLLLANVFAYLLIFFLNLMRLNQVVSIDLLKITCFSWKRLQAMIAFGLPVFSGSMLNMLVVPTTKVVITRFIGLEGVPIFELAYRVGMQVRGIFEVALRALMPEISKLSAKGQQKTNAQIKRIIAKAYRFLFLGAIPLYGILFVLADLIFKLWLGGNFNSTIPSAFRVMLFVSAISLIGVIPYYTAMGRGLTKRILVHHILCATGTLLTLWFFTNIMPMLSITDIMWCFGVGAILGTGYLFIVQYNRIIFIS